MPQELTPPPDRPDVARIRATYSDYEASGRTRLWDAANPGYARLAAELTDRVAHTVRRSLPSRDGRLLDLGCGTGELIDAVDRLGAVDTWVGVDVRPEAIVAAHASYPDASFIVASADELPLADATFDVVVAQLLFSSLPSEQLEQAVAEEIRRVLAPDGWLVWSDIRYSNPSNPNVHGIGRGRLERLFGGWAMELEPAGLLPPVARRLGPATKVLYPALASLPPLRSHFVGRLRPPGTI